MVYAMAWRASNGIWYGLADIALYMVWPGEVCSVERHTLRFTLHALRHCHGL